MERLCTVPPRECKYYNTKPQHLQDFFVCFTIFFSIFRNIFHSFVLFLPFLLSKNTIIPIFYHFLTKQMFYAIAKNLFLHLQNLSHPLEIQLCQILGRHLQKKSPALPAPAKYFFFFYLFRQYMCLIFQFPLQNGRKLCRII